MASLFQLTLRTTHVEAARAFYAALFAAPALHIVELHEQARARGAVPHWLGFLQVPDVDRAAALFVEHGATPLAPKWVNPQGLETAVMRDPGGAVIALARPPGPSYPTSPVPEVTWCDLNTSDLARTKASYGALFGWELAPPREVGSFGVIHPFAWERGAPPAGAMIDTNGRPGVHPHWLFHFRVQKLDPALETVRGAGGTVLGPLTLPNGDRLAVCEDGQGAAFALRELERT